MSSAEMQQYMNIPAVTSNQPYGASDGSNPHITGNSMPKFNVHKNGVHSGHVQMGMQDPFCLQKGKKENASCLLINVAMMHAYVQGSIMPSTSNKYRILENSNFSYNVFSRYRINLVHLT
ncbi:hypothetical protein V6N13_088189 [Hibiscus sabdariffa]|uniref:Uncharacterized protein n=1 Tax=Hibiscus sabdariffa TaxID=183260 RepID=A0ABR2FYQ5_9ROSI